MRKVGMAMAMGMLVWILPEINIFAQMLPPGADDSCTNCPPVVNIPPDYGTNLFLEITNVFDSTVGLLLHNTQPDVPYELLSKETLLDANWVSEGFVSGDEMTNLTPASVDMNRRESLFLEALSWIDSNSNLIPDWWEYKYFGGLQSGDADYDGDGFSNLQEYQNGTDPADYYNGSLPDIIIVNGNIQYGMTNTRLPMSLTALLTDTNSIPLTNAPVTFAISFGDGSIATYRDSVPHHSVQVRTGTDGQATVWLQLSSTNGTNIVTASTRSGMNAAQTNFTEIAAKIPMMAIGMERIMQLTFTDDLISWGGNHYGDLGDYTHLDSSNPVHVAGVTNITKIASGLNHSLALDSSGTLWAWGQNNQGQLGDNSENNTNIPIEVFGMTNVMAIAAHGYSAGSDGLYGLSSAVKTDGTVWMWGSADGGFYFGSSPVQIIEISNAVAVAAGDDYALALLTDGTVWAWGNNSQGQLGDGTMEGDDTPVQVSGLSNVVAICAGDLHSLALDSSGNVWAWGWNHSGQLGDGGEEDYSDVPVAVIGLSNVVEIAAGARHSLAIDNEGRLWAWGDDGNGQLGDGGPNDANLPLQVSGMTNIISIAAGSDASVALDSDGSLWQWGKGIGDGPVWTWGDANQYPQLSPTYFDFYRGHRPNLTITNGNNQTPHAGLEFPQPLVFKVTDTNGMALSNAPVSIEIIAGDMELRTVSGGTNYSGLRLTTDDNGEISLIGYAARDVSHANCLVRVLADSRGQIVEADFNETLISRPTISIISPPDGSTYLIGTNQPLTITVDAEAAAGASIQEVDYSYQTDGGEAMPLAVSTQSPFSFVWTNSLWGSNAFVGQYILSAMAVDDSGAQSDPQSVTVNLVLDSDGNGMPDYWQMQYFGHLGVDPDADPDGDGIGNLQEYENNTDPTDYYNGPLPGLVIMGGNDQCGNYDSFLPLPVTIKVTGTTEPYFASSGLSALPNAPVTFSVTNGTALLAATTNDTPATSLSLRAGSDGRVSVWVYFPSSSSNPPDSTILVSASSGADSTSITVNEFIPMGHWRFDDTNTWIGDVGQLPLTVTNVTGIPSWNSNAVLVDGASPALLSYNVVETNGKPNINCQTGSLLFWFKPDWNSVDRGGTGPGGYGRLIEIGNYDPDFTNGWWGLYLNPDGTQLSFGTSTNGSGMTNLSANISWLASEWYQIALTYSPTGSALYVDGQLLANGDGVAYFPDEDELTNGFRIGSDESGSNQAGGVFDELETFDYPLTAANVATHDSQIPDWWEIKYFGHAGMDPEFQPANDGFTLLIDYLRGGDPNVIHFSLSVTNRFVTNTTVPMRINVNGGVPSYMAVMVNTTNFVVTPNQLFDINSNFIAATWQPYNSNIVVSLDSDDRNYYVWVGLRGVSPDGQKTWEGTKLTLDTIPPTIVITSPATDTVSQPMIQLQGYANESLARLTYDVSNAAGIWTNQTGYLTDQFYDTNLLAFTTNYFQCYDIPLTTNGLNLITLHVADLAGNTSTTNVSFTLVYSTNPPMAALDWPQDGTAVGGTNFILQGLVNDPTATVTVSITDNNGNNHIVQGRVTRNGRVWVNNIPVGNGSNIVTVTTTSITGHGSVTNFTVVGNDVGLTLDALASEQWNQPSVTVTGSIGDSGDTVVVNGVTATVNPDGTWEADGVPVNLSGTAIFTVNIYNGDDLIVSQTFTQSPPARVALMSYSGNFYDSGMAYGSDTWDKADVIFWTDFGGGFESGHDFYSGSGFPHYQPSVHDEWAEVLQGGDNGFNKNRIAETGLFYPGWENSSISESGGTADSHFTVSKEVQTRVMIEPPDQAVPGTMATYLVEAEADGGYLPTFLLTIQGVTLTDEGNGWGYMILSAPADENVDVTPMAAGNYTFDVHATVLDLKLAVDNNRDGQINLDDSDVTTAITPYRFWINDSKESGDISSADNQIPGIQYGGEGSTVVPNYLWANIRGRSDLINYFPVALCLSNTLQQLPPSSGYEYHLVQDDRAVKFVYSSLTPENAFDYLTNIASTGYGKNADEDVTNADTILVTGVPGVTLDTNWLAQVQNNGGNGVILVEGSKATTKPLWLEIWQNGKLLAGTPLCLSIDNVEKMYRHKNFRDGNDAPSGLSGDLTVRDSDASLTTQTNEPQNNPDTASNGRWFIFVVGSNVGGQDSRGWESEVFKRMYWSGNKAKFVGVSWYGDPYTNSEGVYDYHMAVRNAFATAPSLASFVNGLNGNKTIAGHSLGCGLIASAIADQGMNVNNACLMDAAFAQECFDGDADDNLTAMRPSVWQDYPSDLWATHWHERFSNDARANLTWRGRFAGAIGNIYNFYSSTEDCLAEYDGDVPSTTLGAIIASGGHFVNYVWVYQEKAKGKRQDYSPVLGIDILNHFHVGSTYGGWGFNPCDGYLTNYPVWYKINSGGLREMKTPSDIGTVTQDLLDGSRYNPLFKDGWGTFNGNNPSEVYVNVDTSQFTGPNWILGLYDPTGGNTIAADTAKRAQLLAEAVPALSLPVGAHNTSQLNDRNFNMATESVNGINWPSDRGVTSEQVPNWHHSDMDQVAYPYLYKLYKQLVSISNQ